jgi:hypothetical protein
MEVLSLHPYQLDGVGGGGQMSLGQKPKYSVFFVEASP